MLLHSELLRIARMQDAPLLERTNSSGCLDDLCHQGWKASTIVMCYRYLEAKIGFPGGGQRYRVQGDLLEVGWESL